ncbi:hypothetical protein CKO21_02505 [Rhodovibrio salinarum]|uniref:DUF2948 family protein n=1 Tax=Rhodovibrio salinarum TaxID=1087 RepID=A0A934QG21_9PROT|nr:hypothetical protein [Rhodovibrio salinarum]
MFGKRGGSVAPDNKPLKLRAYDKEDFAVVSSVLQDALVPVIDMDWLSEDKRFALVANRFRWERRAPVGDLPDQPAAGAPSAETETQSSADSGQLPQTAEEPDARFEDAPLYERVHCGITFDRVEQVAYRGFTKEASGQVLELLAVVADDRGLTVTFAGDAALRLQGANIVCHLEDLGEPWPTQWRPSHERTEPEQQSDQDAATNRNGNKP